MSAVGCHASTVRTLSHHRVGLVVPSSNVTIETELPRILAAQPGNTFSFHSSRMRMATVSTSELAAMNSQRERCIDELADAVPDVVLYGCLVAVMAEGAGAHRQTENSIETQLRRRKVGAAVASSAGALLEALCALEVERVALVTPYVPSLAGQVVDYICAEGFKVVDFAALGIADNCAVGRIEAEHIRSAVGGLKLGNADALVISACVQMPSLDLVQPAEDELGMPVLSAATAGAFSLLSRLGVAPRCGGLGRLLAGPRANAS